jgi:hypothetical protein
VELKTGGSDGLLPTNYEPNIDRTKDKRQPNGIVRCSLLFAAPELKWLQSATERVAAWNGFEDPELNFNDN